MAVTVKQATLYDPITGDRKQVDVGTKGIFDPSKDHPSGWKLETNPQNSFQLQQQRKVALQAPSPVANQPVGGTLDRTLAIQRQITAGATPAQAAEQAAAMIGMGVKSYSPQETQALRAAIPATFASPAPIQQSQPTASTPQVADPYTRYQQMLSDIMKDAQGTGNANLEAQKNALITARFNAVNDITPEALRGLSAAQQESLRSGDVSGINSMLQGVNTALSARENQRKEALDRAKFLSSVVDKPEKTSTAVLTIDKALTLAAASPDPAAAMKALIPYIGKTSADAQKILSAEGTSTDALSAIAKARTGTQLSDGDAHVIAQAIVNGDQPPELTGLYRAGPQVRAELEKLGYNYTSANLDYQALKTFTKTLNGSKITTLRSAAQTAYDSLDLVDEYSTQWKRGGFGPLNKVQMLAAKSGTLGQEAQQLAVLLDQQIADVAGELGTVYKGGNGATDEALKLAGTQLDSNWSDATLHAATQNARKNLQIRLNSYKNLGAISATGNEVGGSSGSGAGDDEANKALDAIGFKAVLGTTKKGQLPTIAYSTGEIKEGGTASWRNNNPGNIKIGPYAEQYGAVKGSAALDGGNFATFPTLEAGLKAQRDLLRGKNYGDANLNYALKRWSGGVDKNTGRINEAGYGIEIVPMDLRRKTFNTMTDEELNRVIQEQIKVEGWQAGKSSFA